ncbi:MAG: C39 family peptidase [Oenococcus sp.]|uniref:C39 family peptidase n=1 Tax=Oenococcus sp. TaxID=1979414 RepID=UPI0039EC8101
MKSSWKNTQPGEEKYFVLGVENIDQNAYSAINGCEAASLLAALHFVGKAREFDYPAFLDTMPIDPDGNPYKGLGGSPFKNTPGKLEAIFIDPLVRWGSLFGSLTALPGAELNDLLKIVKFGWPLLTYVSIGFAPFGEEDFSFGHELTNNHAVVLDGYSESYVHLSDPIDGQYWLLKSRFKERYDVRKWAVKIA